jgi:glycerophosphoryl diester phosphodiesterase
MNSGFGYWAGPKPRILAHRGLITEDSPVENTLESFAAALEAGADIIETDIQASKDGVAIVFHDADLSRLAGRPESVTDFDYAQLAEIELLGGGRISSLEAVLMAFPAAKFNLDVKSAAAISAVAEVVNRLGCNDRVLITSFSEARRSKTLALLPLKTASSASAALLIAIYVLIALGLSFFVPVCSKRVKALQVPTKAGFLRLDRSRFIRAVHRSGIEIHFWTINEAGEMKRLVSLGADGIVTDRADLAVKTLRKVS